MRNVDKHTLIQLEDLDAVVDKLVAVFPTAASAAEAVHLGSRSSGIGVKTNTISDPTANAALDPRRAHKQSNVKKARKEIKTALIATRQALAHLNLAADI